MVSKLSHFLKLNLEGGYRTNSGREGRVLPRTLLPLSFYFMLLEVRGRCSGEGGLSPAQSGKALKRLASSRKSI